MLRITATDDSPAAVTASALWRSNSGRWEATRWPNAETSSPQYGRVAEIACELDVGSNVESSLRQFALLDPEGNPIDPANAGAYDEKGSHQVTFRMISDSIHKLDVTSDGHIHLECPRLEHFIATPLHLHLKLAEATGSSSNPGGSSVVRATIRLAGYRCTAPSWIPVNLTSGLLIPGDLQVSINENFPLARKLQEAYLPSILMAAAHRRQH